MKKYVLYVLSINPYISLVKKDIKIIPPKSDLSFLNSEYLIYKCHINRPNPTNPDMTIMDKIEL